MDIQIRQIQLSDVASYRRAVGAVAREKKYLTTIDAYPLDQTTDYVRNHIDNNYAQYVAIHDDEVVGWVDITPSPRVTNRHIGTLGMGIIAAYRGRGLGSRLLAAAIEHAWNTGLTRLQLDVLVNNQRAIALYEKHGFQLEGTKRYASLIDGKYRDIQVMAQYRI